MDPRNHPPAASAPAGRRHDGAGQDPLRRRPAAERVRPGHVRGAAADGDGSRIAGARYPHVSARYRRVERHHPRRVGLCRPARPAGRADSCGPRPARRGWPPQGRRAGARPPSRPRRSMRCCWPILARHWRRSRALLPYYDVDQPAVRVLGPALWASPAARAGAGLGGALYAAPDPATRSDFDQRYSAANNGNSAPGLADFAHDAAAIARVLSTDGGFSVASAFAGRMVSPGWTACWCCSRMARCAGDWPCSKSSAAAR